MTNFEIRKFRLLTGRAPRCLACRADRRGDQIVLGRSDDFAGDDLPGFEPLAGDVDDAIDIGSIGVGAAEPGIFFCRRARLIE